MIVVEVVFLAIFWTWAVSAVLFLRNTVLPRDPVTSTPAQFSLPCEPVRFQATDGMWLEGWKVPADPVRPWIILCHGVGSNRSNLLDIAAGLHEAGFNLFLFDFRGHGGSRGLVTSFGWFEQRDLEGALAFLGQQPDIPARSYGVYGISMGGSVALMVAARDERIGAVVADSPYTSLDQTLDRHLGLLYPWAPRVPFLWFILATYRIRFGVWPSQLSPLRSAARLAPRPLFLIQGGSDIRMLPEETRRIHEAAGEPKALWVVDGADHLGSFSLQPDAYRSRLTMFFESRLITLI